MVKCYLCENMTYPHHNMGLCGTCHGTISIPRTQKGTGIRVLQGLIPSMALGNTLFIHDEAHVPPEGYPIFARPAPSQPRHGYIDSRSVKSPEEARKLLKEVLTDDPNGELILCKFIKAAYSGILTPGSLVVGPGHDGATAGKNTATIPLTSGLRISPEVLAAAKIKKGEWPYLELVQTAQGTCSVVQLRSGPKIVGVSGDYIEKSTLVQEVLKADPKEFQDLGWEHAIEKASGKPGVVVWHPDGALTDHFSIHAVLHKIPVVFGTEPPALGEVLEPTVDKVAAYDPHAMLMGIMAGDELPIRYNTETKVPLIDPSRAVTMMLIALHNSLVMRGDASKWLGLAVAIMIRMGSVALRGEARHFWDWKGNKPLRDQIYRRHIEKSLSYHRASLNRLVNVFRYGRWMSSGFGGPKWATCGAAMVGLFDGVRNLAQDPTPENAEKLIAALNLAVNQAHNGGWWLNKFITPSVFNELPNGPIELLAPSTGAFFVAHKIMKGLSQKHINRSIKRYQEWPDTILTPPYALSADMTIQPGTGNVKLTVATKLLKTKFRQIMLTVPKEHVKSLKNHVYLVEGADGYQMEIRTKDQDPIIVWKDDSIQQKAVEVSKNIKI